MTTDRIQIELTRDDWIALLVAASYGSDALEADVGGAAAGTADRIVEKLKPILHIYSLRDEAFNLERRLRKINE